MTDAMTFMGNFIPKFKAKFPGVAEILVTKIAAGFAGNISHESSFGVTRYGDGGNALGLCQWNGSRFDRLVSNRSSDWDSENGQIEFILHELANKEKRTQR